MSTPIKAEVKATTKVKDHKYYENQFVTGLNSYTDFLTDLIQTAYKRKHTTINPNIIAFGSGVANSKIKENGNRWVMEQFIDKSHKYWIHIKKRDLDYLMKNFHEMMPIMPKEYSDDFHKLFTGTNDKNKPLVDEDDLEAFWEFIDTFVKLGINHIHVNRKPEYKEEVHNYTVTYFPDVKVGDMAKEFNVKF